MNITLGYARYTENRRMTCRFGYHLTGKVPISLVRGQKKFMKILPALEHCSYEEAGVIFLGT